MLEVEIQNSKIKQKKTGGIWPLLALGAGIGGLWYYNKRKKEKERLALAAQSRAGELRAQQQQRQTRTPQRQSLRRNSPEARLLAQGEGYKGSNPTARAEHKEL